MKRSLFLLLLSLGSFTFGQQRAITGTVTDEGHVPLPGGTVLVKGTSRGTTTDFDGHYCIQADQGEVLQFTYVGYATKEVAIGASNVINVSLRLDGELDEVVVMGARQCSQHC